MKKVYCASILKPLYAHAAGENYAALAEKAIVYSDNAATDILVDQLGGLKAALDKIALTTGVRWEVNDSWGKIVINELSLKVAYSSLIQKSDPWSSTIKLFMSNVVSEQRFGIPDKIPMKAGWDLDESNCSLLTHVVVLLKNRAMVKVTSIPITNTQSKQWKELVSTSGPSSVVPLHRSATDFLLQELRTKSAEFLFNSRLL